MTQQYVWGHEYLDQLLMIRGANGTWFVHQDANWNVIALTTPSGDVAEEVQYQPYGLPQVRRHLAFGDSDADGDVDASDSTARTAALSTYNRAFDADFDGDVSNTSGDADQEAWDASYNDPAASTTMVVANRSFSPNGNPFLFTGRRLDAETGLYFYRFRTYHPALKQFIQRDPLGYVDSASLYQYVGGRPTAAGDPLGLSRDVPPDWPPPIPGKPWPGKIGDDVSNDPSADDGTNDAEHCERLKRIRTDAALDELAHEVAQAAIVAKEAAKVSIVIFGIFVPDPSDAMWALILSRQGLQILKFGGKWVVKKGEEVLDAIKARSELRKALNALDEARRKARKAYNTNPAFRRWFHTKYKPDVKVPGGKGGRTNPDLTDDELADAYEQWQELQEQSRRGRRGRDQDP
ncbi:MAG: RHS repeat-associated core domain-containing protein [Planctomycetia bacterium]|nr:RHS repeat-associated core domain-containing protein [Planctomycetia bacterium]